MTRGHACPLKNIRNYLTKWGVRGAWLRHDWCSEESQYDRLSYCIRVDTSRQAFSGPAYQRGQCPSQTGCLSRLVRTCRSPRGAGKMPLAAIDDGMYLDQNAFDAQKVA